MPPKMWPLVSILLALVACGTKSTAPADTVPAKYKAFEGTYDLASALASVDSCDVVTHDAAAETPAKTYLIYAKSLSGQQSLYIQGCEADADCKVDDLPVFVPNVSEGELPTLTGEYLHSSSYLESGKSCLLSRSTIALTQDDANDATMTQTTYEGKVAVDAKDSCIPGLIAASVDSLKCTKISALHLHRQGA